MTAQQARVEVSASRKKKRSVIRRSRLNKRLAAYSALGAGAVVGAVSSVAHATPVLHNIPDVTTPGLPGLLFDIVAGTTTLATNFVHPAVPHVFRLAHANNAVLYGDSTTAAFVMTGIYASELDTSFSVGAGATTFGAAGTNLGANFALLATTGGGGPWQDGDRGFIGLTFQIAGAQHFGWAEITQNADRSVTLHAFGYNDEPREPSHINPAIPEPANLALLALGAAGVAAFRRRQRQKLA